LQYCQKLASPNFTHVKKESEQNYAYSGKTVIVYDGMESLRAKVRYLHPALMPIAPFDYLNYRLISRERKWLG
jgi:hypothetical protein